MLTIASLNTTRTRHASADDAKVTPVGYVEAYYQYNFNSPASGITAYRGFDNRANSFTLQNVALGAQVDAGSVTGRAVLQVGSAGASYYMNEPSRPGGGGASASNAELWRYVQEAWAGYKAPVGTGLNLQLGLFLSPIGPEVVPVKDNWTWSRSNLFFALPYYHAGLRASYDLTDALSAQVGVYNGWNDAADNNEDKSVSASLAYKIADRLFAQVLYFGGDERASGAPEGPYWRHDFDAYAQLDITSRLAVLAHGNGGFEPNRFGTSSWYGGSLAWRLKTLEWLYVVARGDRFGEHVAENAVGRAANIFFPTGVSWVSSGTITLDARPADHLSIRLEYRHDAADAALYFRSWTASDPATGAPLPNARSQDTLTLGATAWL